MLQTGEGDEAAASQAPAESQQDGAQQATATPGPAAEGEHDAVTVELPPLTDSVFEPPPDSSAPTLEFKRPGSGRASTRGDTTILPATPKPGQTTILPAAPKPGETTILPPSQRPQEPPVEPGAITREFSSAITARLPPVPQPSGRTSSRRLPPARATTRTQRLPAAPRPSSKRMRSASSSGAARAVQAVGWRARVLQALRPWHTRVALVAGGLLFIGLVAALTFRGRLPAVSPSPRRSRPRRAARGRTGRRPGPVAVKATSSEEPSAEAAGTEAPPDRKLAGDQRPGPDEGLGPEAGPGEGSGGEEPAIARVPPVPALAGEGDPGVEQETGMGEVADEFAAAGAPEIPYIYIQTPLTPSADTVSPLGGADAGLRGTEFATAHDLASALEGTAWGRGVSEETTGRSRAAQLEAVERALKALDSPSAHAEARAGTSEGISADDSEGTPGEITEDGERRVRKELALNAVEEIDPLALGRTTLFDLAHAEGKTSVRVSRDGLIELVETNVPVQLTVAGAEGNEVKIDLESGEQVSAWPVALASVHALGDRFTVNAMTADWAFAVRADEVRLDGVPVRCDDLPCVLHTGERLDTDRFGSRVVLRVAGQTWPGSLVRLLVGAGRRRLRSDETSSDPARPGVFADRSRDFPWQSVPLPLIDR